jgi:hypothetical protein
VGIYSIHTKMCFLPLPDPPAFSLSFNTFHHLHTHAQFVLRYESAVCLLCSTHFHPTQPALPTFLPSFLPSFFVQL